MPNSIARHLSHCCLLATVIILFEYGSGALFNENRPELDPWSDYGILGALFLYLLRALTFLSFPQVLFNFFGFTIYNAFPDKVVLKGSPLLAPFICIRVVTRGDYPQLVKTNVRRNLNKCTEAGLENFQIEVVSDKPIGLTPHRRIREVVVPTSYRTSSGALFKARALQYCLENSVNELADHDWIVHLDEETLLTDNSVRGILNFVLDGKHQFGQGLITYANEDVVNWITTLADSFRVADDMGKLRLQFTMFHKPLFSMKGSFVVTQVIGFVLCEYCRNKGFSETMPKELNLIKMVHLIFIHSPDRQCIKNIQVLCRFICLVNFFSKFVVEYQIFQSIFI